MWDTVASNNNVEVNPICLARTNQNVSCGINASTSSRLMHLVRSQCGEHRVAVRVMGTNERIKVVRNIEDSRKLRVLGAGSGLSASWYTGGNLFDPERLPDSATYIISAPLSRCIIVLAKYMVHRRLRLGFTILICLFHHISQLDRPSTRWR